MRLDPNSWHVRCYFSATALFEAWKGSPYPTEFTTPIDTNICPYLRRMLVTFPLLLVFYISLIAWVANAVLIYPIMHFGWIYYAVVGAGAAAVAAFIGVIGLMVNYAPRFTAFLYRWICGPIDRFFMRLVEATEDCILGKPDAPTFCAVVRQWIVDRHHQICRPLVIGGKE